MIVRHLIAGLCILGKYGVLATEQEIQMGHDVLYVGGPDPADMNEDDVSEIRRMGFHYEVDEESWAVFA